MNQNLSKLSKTIIDYSCEIKKNQKVIIEMTGESCQPLVDLLIKKLEAKDVQVSVLDKSYSTYIPMLKSLDEVAIKSMAKKELAQLKHTDVYIMIKSINYPNMMQEIPEETMVLYNKYYIKPIHAYVLNQTRWLSLRYPNDRMAKAAGMTLEAFTAYYFEVCNIDYPTLSKAMLALVKLMEDTKIVKIKGPGTDLSFSIENMPVHKCDGLINLPDGEVYTAPVKDSINGCIHYNVPSYYRGHYFEDVKLIIENGKIIKGITENQLALDKILDTDDGARFIGEFALGVNPYVLKPIKDILFDEKIAGSFHLTPGFSYDNASNGNSSAVHWDLVCIQTKNYGGGEMYFDEILIRKDGLFLEEILLPLNPIIITKL